MKTLKFVCLFVSLLHGINIDGQNIPTKVYDLSASISFSVPVGNKVIMHSEWYVGNYNSIDSLMVSDGTLEGTHVIGTFKRLDNPRIKTRYINTPVINDTYFFLAKKEDGANFELWKTDGTQLGTQQISTFSADNLKPIYIARFLDQILVAVYNGETGYHTIMLANVSGEIVDLEIIMRSTVLFNIENDKIYYIGYDGANDGLYCSGGIKGDSEFLGSLDDIYTINPTSTGVFLEGKKEIIDNVGIEWYKYSQDEGIQLVNDIYPGSYSSEASGEETYLQNNGHVSIWENKQRLYFFAEKDNTGHIHLCSTNGQPGDLVTHSSTALGDMYDLFVFNSEVFFLKKKLIGNTEAFILHKLNVEGMDEAILVDEQYLEVVSYPYLDIRFKSAYPIIAHNNSLYFHGRPVHINNPDSLYDNLFEFNVKENKLRSIIDTSFSKYTSDFRLVNLCAEKLYFTGKREIYTLNIAEKDTVVEDTTTQNTANENKITIEGYSYIGEGKDSVNFSTKEITYDDFGRTISETVSYTDHQDSLLKFTDETHYKYDDTTRDTLMYAFKNTIYYGTDSIEAYGERVEFTYNEKGKLTEELKKYWNQTKEAWLNYQKTITTYNEKDLITCIEPLSWNEDNSNWIPNLINVTTGKKTFKYDNNNNIIESIHYQTNGTNWVAFYKVERLFDEDNNLLYQADRFMNNGSWMEPKEEIVNTYTFYPDKKVQTKFMKVKWFESNEWVESKMTYQYNLNGLTVSTVNQVKDVLGNWINSSKDSVDYDNQGNIILQINYSIGDANEWVEKFRNEYAFDDAHRKIMEVYYYWNTSGEMVGNSKIERIYYNSNDLIFYANYAWDIEMNDWYLNTKREWTYTENGRLLTNINYRIGNLARDLYINHKYENVYRGDLLVSHSEMSAEYGKPLYGIISNEYSYNGRNDTLAMTLKRWDHITQNWKKTEKYFYETVHKICVDSVLNIIACEQYEFMGQIYTQSGVYVQETFNTTGCDTIITLNLTITEPTTETDVQTACASFTWIDGNTYTESNNVATFTLTNAAGCDSIVTLNLTITNLDASISQENTVLTANPSNAAYQWFDCNYNIPVADATNQNFRPVVSGQYAVIVEMENCTDTSECLAVTITSFEVNELGAIKIYPNPVDDFLIIEGVEKFTTVEIYDVFGKKVLFLNSPYTEKPVIDMQVLEQGVYFIKIYNPSGFNITTVLKN